MGDPVILDEASDGLRARAEYPGRLLDREAAIEGLRPVLLPWGQFSPKTWIG
jgi:hypothetical protein